MQCSNPGSCPRQPDRPPSDASAPHRSGKIPEPGAPTLRDGSSAASLNRQGLALEAAQRFTEAEHLYRTALTVDSGSPETYLNLAALMHRRPERYEESIELCRHALQLKPDWVNVWVLMGCIYQSRSVWDQAQACHQKALEIAPDLTEAHQNLGLVLAAQNCHLQAVDHFRTALAQRPHCARTWNDLGISLRACGLLQDALSAYGRAIECDPDLATAWFHKGNVFQDLKRHDEAAKAFRQAVELDSSRPDAWNNLGFALEALGQSEAAVDCFQKALRQNPSLSEGYLNLARSLKEIGRIKEAIACCRKAIQRRPDLSAAYWNLSLSLLQNGQLHEGFSLYHYRRHPDLKFFSEPHDLPAPRWDGGSFTGKTLLVYCEQGLGDSIQFSRYLRAVRRLGGRVILETPPALVRLLTESRIADEVIAMCTDKPPVQCDLCASVMDLPSIFGTTLETIPGECPYLSAAPQDIQRWRQRIDPEGCKIGLVWAGNPRHENDRRRSVDPALLAGLQGVNCDIRFFSLQVGDSAGALKTLSKTLCIENLAPELTDLSETAAAMMCLDLIISVDTSAAHLAGALGRPVWTLLPYCPDWRWLLGRNNSPWYPGMRLFRQRQRGNWGGVFDELRQELGHACLSEHVRRML